MNQTIIHLKQIIGHMVDVCIQVNNVLDDLYRPPLPAHMHPFVSPDDMTNILRQVHEEFSPLTSSNGSTIYGDIFMQPPQGTLSGSVPVPQLPSSLVNVADYSPISPVDPGFTTYPAENMCGFVALNTPVFDLPSPLPPSLAQYIVPTFTPVLLPTSPQQNIQVIDITTPPPLATIPSPRCHAGPRTYHLRRHQLNRRPARKAKTEALRRILNTQ